MSAGRGRDTNYDLSMAAWGGRNTFPVADLLPEQLAGQCLRGLVALLDRARAGADARVVHEHVDVLLAFSDLLHKPLERGLRGVVAGEQDELPTRVRERVVPFRGGLVEHVFPPAGDETRAPLFAYAWAIRRPAGNLSDKA